MSRHMIKDVEHGDILYRTAIEDFLDYYDGLKQDMDPDNHEGDGWGPEDYELTQDQLDEYDEDVVNELRAMLEESEDDSFISEDYWLKYAEEFFDECCAPSIPEAYREYIDYDKWADDLSMDYTTIDYDGVTYYARA